MLGASLIVSLLTLLGSVISFLNQLVIAKLFGASMRMDVFLLATSVPTLVAGTIGAVLSYSMVPALIEYKSDPVTYGLFTGAMLSCVLLFAIVLFGIGYVFAQPLVFFLGRDLSALAQAEATAITRVAWMSAGAMVVVEYLAAVHNASRRFISPVLARMVPFAMMIGFGLAYGPAFGPVAVAWGMLTGAVLALGWLLIRAAGEMRVSRACLGFAGTVGRYFCQVPLIMLGMLCFTVYQSIDAFWAPRLGEGNLAYLGYCQRLLIATGSLVIAGPSVVLVPHLAEKFLAGQHADFLRDTGRAVRTVMAVAGAAAVIIAPLAVPTTELMFKRGAFDGQAVAGVASILPLLMTGMVPMVCVVILFRAFFAKRDALAPALLGVCAAVLYFGLSGALSGVLSVKGIALAYLLSWWTLLGLSLLAIHRGSLGRLLSAENLRFLACLTAAAFLTGLSVHLLAGLLVKPVDEVGFIALLVRTALCGTIGGGVFCAATAGLFRMPDVRHILGYPWRLLTQFTPARPTAARP